LIWQSKKHFQYYLKENRVIKKKIRFKKTLKNESNRTQNIQTIETIETPNFNQQKKEKFNEFQNIQKIPKNIISELTKIPAHQQVNLLEHNQNIYNKYFKEITEYKKLFSGQYISLHGSTNIFDSFIVPDRCCVIMFSKLNELSYM
jgi:hypothetical protein